MCLPIVFLLCDIYIVGNWHAEAVEEYEEAEITDSGKLFQALIISPSLRKPVLTA